MIIKGCMGLFSSLPPQIAPSKIIPLKGFVPYVDTSSCIICWVGEGKGWFIMSDDLAQWGQDSCKSLETMFTTCVQQHKKKEERKHIRTEHILLHLGNLQLYCCSLLIFSHSQFILIREMLLYTDMYVLRLFI